MYDSINNPATFAELQQLSIILGKRGVLKEDQLQQMIQAAEEAKLSKAVAYFKEVLRLQEESNGNAVES